MKYCVVSTRSTAAATSSLIEAYWRLRSSMGTGSGLTEAEEETGAGEVLSVMTKSNSSSTTRDYCGKRLLLLELNLDADFAFAGDFHGCAILQIRLQRGGAGPIEAPAVLNRNRDIGSGQHGRQSKGPVTIALVAAEQQPVGRRVLRDEYHHASSEGLLVTQHDSADLRHGAGSSAHQLHASAAADFEGVASSFGSLGQEFIHVESRRIRQSNIVGSRTNFFVRKIEHALVRHLSSEVFSGGAIEEFNEHLPAWPGPALQYDRAADRSQRWVFGGIEFDGARQIDLLIPTGTVPLAARFGHLDHVVSGRDSGVLVHGCGVAKALRRIHRHQSSLKDALRDPRKADANAIAVIVPFGFAALDT